MNILRILPICLAVAFLPVSVMADMKAAVNEIVATVHGITKTEIKGNRIILEAINVGADYDFMSQVSCRLLLKHGISEITQVVIQGSVGDGKDQKMLGKFDCNKATK